MSITPNVCLDHLQNNFNYMALHEFVHPRDFGYQELGRDYRREVLDWVYADLTTFLTIGGVANKYTGRVRVLGDISRQLNLKLRSHLESEGIVYLSITTLHRNSTIDLRSFEPDDWAVLTKSGLIDELHWLRERNGGVYLRRNRPDNSTIGVDGLGQFTATMIKTALDEAHLQPPQNTRRVATAMLRQIVSDEVVAETDSATKKSQRQPRETTTRPHNPKWLKMSDNDLVRIFQGGETDAFGVFFERYYREILGFMTIKLRGDVETAENLAMQVFTKALESLKGYEEHGALFKGWLFRIAKNTVIDYFRTTPELVPHEYLDEISPEQAPLLYDHEIKTKIHSDHHRLRHALLDLTDDQARVVQLRIFQELSIKEVAEVLERTEGAVKALLNRALARLSRNLSEETPPTGVGIKTFWTGIIEPGKVAQELTYISPSIAYHLDRLNDLQRSRLLSHYKLDTDTRKTNQITRRRFNSLQIMRAQLRIMGPEKFISFWNRILEM